MSRVPIACWFLILIRIGLGGIIFAIFIGLLRRCSIKFTIAYLVVKSNALLSEVLEIKEQFVPLCAALKQLQYLNW